MAALGKIIAKLRKDRGMTQRELAELLHVSVSTVSNYEQGIHEPDIEKLLKIAACFHVTTDYLLGASNNNLSPDVFMESVGPGKTVGEYIQEFLCLSQDHKNVLLLIQSEMAFHEAINNYREKGEK